jgi:hypothetical protein
MGAPLLSTVGFDVHLHGRLIFAQGGATLVDMYHPIYIPIAFSFWVGRDALRRAVLTRGPAGHLCGCPAIGPVSKLARLGLCSLLMQKQVGNYAVVSTLRLRPLY